MYFTRLARGKAKNLPPAPDAPNKPVLRKQQMYEHIAYEKLEKTFLKSFQWQLHKLTLQLLTAGFYYV